MVEQTVEEVAEAMKKDPHTWAKMYLDLRKEMDKFELLVAEHQSKMQIMLQ